VDALGYDDSQKLIYIPAGKDGNVTVASGRAGQVHNRVVADRADDGGWQDDRRRSGQAHGAGPARGPITYAWLYAISH
jgi:hypothetical protein